MINETFLDTDLVKEGGQAAYDATTKNLGRIAGLVEQIRTLLDADFGAGADGEAFRKAHREVAGALDLAEKSLKLIEEAAWNVKTAAGNTEAADAAAEAILKSIPRPSTGHLRS